MNVEQSLILGKGFIGTRLSQLLEIDCIDTRVNSFDDVSNIVDTYNPKILINCIGSTGENNTDDCEKEKEKTLYANTYIPILLAEVCMRKNIKLVHISSGCLFHYEYGKSEAIEEHFCPDFFDLFYSRSKIYSDIVLERLSLQYNILICRIRIPIDYVPHPKNLLTKLLRYKKVITMPNSITYLPDFAEMLYHLIMIDARGIYNCTNEGALFYPKLMDAYGAEYSILDNLNLVRTNLIMSVDELKNSGFVVRNINDIIGEIVTLYREEIKKNG